LDVPWLELVEVDVAYDVQVDLLGGDLLAEVVVEQLLLRRMEPEPRRHAWLPVHRDAHWSPSLFVSIYYSKLAIYHCFWFELFLVQLELSAVCASWGEEEELETMRRKTKKLVAEEERRGLI
jgi:hypothetical protein